jgi:hypothetical protein
MQPTRDNRLWSAFGPLDIDLAVRFTAERLKQLMPFGWRFVMRSDDLNDALALVPLSQETNDPKQRGCDPPSRASAAIAIVHGQVPATNPHSEIPWVS